MIGVVDVYPPREEVREEDTQEGGREMCYEGNEYPARRALVTPSRTGD